MITENDFYGPNLGYILELYERFQDDPDSVDESTRQFFQHWKPPASGDSTLPTPPNLILLSKAAVYCGLNEFNAIALGPLKTNLFADSSTEFFSGFERLVERAMNRRFEILTPFSHLSKREVMVRGRSLPLELTFSCLKPLGNVHCGACNKCAERMGAFADAGIIDRTRYKNFAPVKKKHEGLQAVRPVGS